MKLAPLVALLFLPVAAFANDTAYQALRTVGAKRDQSLMSKVMELKGRSGVPQPESWFILLDDPFARGGIREMEVSSGDIVSERTPLKTEEGKALPAVMDLQKLNLDSAGAFSIAEEEAKKARISFDAVDYALRSTDANVAPIWTLTLLDTAARSIGTLKISADTGAILSKTFGKATVQGSSAAAPVRSSVVARSGEDNTPEPGQTKNLGHKIDRAFHETGATLEEFFTGERTLDKRFCDE